MNVSLLSTQLAVLKTTDIAGSAATIPELAAMLSGQGVTVRAMLSEVIKLVCLVSTVPCSGASAERSFSALRQVKNYMRSTMLQGRLTHLLMLFIHQKEALSIMVASMSCQSLSGPAQRFELVCLDPSEIR